MIKITDYIKLYDNILSEEDCEDIIKYVKDGDFKNSHVNGDGTGKKLIVDKTTRNCYVKDLDLQYDGIVFKGVEKAISNYQIDFPHFYIGANANDTGYEHLLYKGSEKGTYTTHTDSFDSAPRLISISILLNDNFDGGNFCFFDEHILEKKIGSAVVFPSNFCFPHSVLPVSNGDRHAIITWLR